MNHHPVTSFPAAFTILVDICGQAKDTSPSLDVSVWVRECNCPIDRGLRSRRFYLPVRAPYFASIASASSVWGTPSISAGGTHAFSSMRGTPAISSASSSKATPEILSASSSRICPTAGTPGISSASSSCMSSSTLSSSEPSSSSSSSSGW